MTRLAYALAAALFLPAVAVQAQTAAAPGAVTVAGLTGGPVPLAPATLAALPAVTLHVSFDTDHGPMSATFQGPLLWSVWSMKARFRPPTRVTRYTRRCW